MTIDIFSGLDTPEHEPEPAEGQRQCDHCDRIIDGEEYITTGGGNIICDECAADYYERCEVTGYYYHCDDIRDVRDSSHRRTTVRVGPAAETWHCACCGNEYLEDVGYQVVYDECVCHRCIAGHYIWCDRCEAYRHLDDDACCDDGDDDDDDGDLIHAYGANVLDTHGFKHCSCETVSEKTLFMGVELECMTESVSYVHDAVSDFAILKSDGSISEAEGTGIEIVSAPATYAKHKELWSELFDAQEIKVDRSCGMHVHLSTSAFSPLHLGKFLCFFGTDANYTLLRAVAGRDYRRNTYVSCTHFEFNPKITDIAKDGKAKAKLKSTRYWPVNLTNSRTIEVRVFAATTKEWRFRGRLEFLHAVYNWTKTEGMRNLTSERFIEYVMKHKREYANLVRIFKHKEIV